MTQQNVAAALFNTLLQLRETARQEAQNPVVQFLDFCAKNYTSSHSQLFQDLFVLFCTKGRRNGFFVEFGATNGVTLSNSYLLEKEFAWQGILAEPAKDWHAALQKNRSAAIDTRCVWRKTGEHLDFVETEYGELSTLVEFKDKDNNKSGRQAGKTYSVETVSLNDLLAKYNSPGHIDYLSIDTEGSEFDILSALNFSRYAIDIMTVEHNYTQDRSKIRSLLASNGFVNVFEAISGFDDWFLHQSFLQKLQA